MLARTTTLLAVLLISVTAGVLPGHAQRACDPLDSPDCRTPRERDTFAEVIASGPAVAGGRDIMAEPEQTVVPRAVIDEHLARVRQVEAARVCAQQASEVFETVVALRTESRPLVQRALAMYLAATRSTLEQCMLAVPGTTATPAVRFILDELAESVGAFDQSAVTRMLMTRRSAIQACYERVLRADPAARLEAVSVNFTISTGGSVVATLRPETRAIPDISSCVVRVISGFRFNPGPDGGPVSYSVSTTFGAP